MKNIFILTGAGISAESGIATFRAEDGLWEKHKVEDVATPDGFRRNPELVHNFYNERRRQLKTVTPNAAHFALAKLYNNYSQGIVTIVTQNIDDLHERAGATAIHMHGELEKMLCLNCRKSCLWQEDSSIESICTNCEKRGVLRPDIVWFGEMPYFLAEIESCLLKSSLFVAIGTSGLVYPAAGYVQLARAAKIKTLEMNLEKTAASQFFDAGIYGKAGQTVTEWVEEILIK
ncbi:MAG: NAD-dependent deacylase [Cardiobacteriaceae bacterium]|nr:NAD-dependent deacylase [Cardiobacteriaceae bacterium]